MRGSAQRFWRERASGRRGGQRGRAAPASAGAAAPAARRPPASPRARGHATGLQVTEATVTSPSPAAGCVPVRAPAGRSRRKRGWRPVARTIMAWRRRFRLAPISTMTMNSLTRCDRVRWRVPSPSMQSDHRMRCGGGCEEACAVWCTVCMTPHIVSQDPVPAVSRTPRDDRDHHVSRSERSAAHGPTVRLNGGAWPYDRGHGDDGLVAPG